MATPQINKCINDFLIIESTFNKVGIFISLKAKTSHTLNRVPFFVYGADVKLKHEDNLGLSNIAATVCELLGVEPNEHWNESLIEK